MKLAIILIICLVLLIILIAKLLLNLAKLTKKQKQLEAALELNQGRWQLALEASQEGIWDWDIETRAVYYSPRWEEIFGIKPGEAPPTPETFTSLVHPDELDEVVEETQRCLRKEIPYFKKEIRMFHKNGTPLWTLQSASVILNEAGKPVRMIGTTIDITERKKAEDAEGKRHEEALKHQHILFQLSSLPLHLSCEEKLKTIIRKSAETLNCERVSVWVFDENFSILTTDFIYKLSANAYLPGLILHQPDYPTYFEQLKKNEYIIANDAHSHPWTTKFSANYLTPLGISSMMDIPLREGELIIGVICHEHVGMPRNWTESERSFASSVSNLISLALESEKRRKTEEELIKSQFNFEEAQKIAHVGNWEFDLRSGKLFWSKETYRLFELENHPPETLYEAYRNKIPPDDLPRLDACIKRAVEHGEPYTLEHRILCKDNSFKYLSCICEPVKDAAGNVIGLRGTDQDITLQKQAALAKSEFLSIMSHEIRTPINGVVGIVNLLAEENLTNLQREYINTLNFSAQHLAMIVSDILDFSKIESGNLTFEKVCFDLEGLCHNVFNLFKNKAQEKNIDYCFVPGQPLEEALLGDVLRLNQILANLLSNAIKFTEKGRVEFSYAIREETPEHVRLIFSIKDTGIGIREAQQEKIFEYFYQGDESISRKYGGTGLGLSISKKLVELQGGKISMESNAGKGSLFTVELKFEKNKYSIEPTPEIPDLPESSEEMLRGMKILVAEDHHINAMVLIRLLERWEVATTLVNDGKEAVERLEQEDFDLVLMDIWMPNMDGLQALKLLRNSDQEALRKIPVIAFTADASVESIRGFLNSGFDDCITKPFNPKNLFLLLKKYHSPSVTPNPVEKPGEKMQRRAKSKA